jgi:isoquinoline 1-oxidoreductase beta subunit
LRIDRRTVLIGGGVGIGLVVAFALVEPAPLAEGYSNPVADDEGWAKDLRVTAGSTSIRAFERPLREAAAIARSMLVGAAADRWNIAPHECETADGFVINGVRTFSFGELAEEAADRSPPLRPQLRTGSRGRLIGQPLQRLDGPSKCDGSMRFAGDVRLPGMLFASARLAPPGGRLLHFSREEIRSVPGVRHVDERANALAIAADSWWSAERAVHAAGAKFSGAEMKPDVRPQFEEALAEGYASEWFSRGDYNSTVQGSRPLASTYYVAPSLHLGLEPLTATARFTGDHLEIWVPTQAPDAARDRAQKAAAGARVSLYPMPPGEPAGRALEADAIPLAVELARATGRPVQLSLSQSASQNHDHPSGGMMARMMALPGQGGITAAWKMRVATAGGFGATLAALDGADAPAKLGRADLDGSVPPYGIPHVAVDSFTVPVAYEAGYMRGSPQREFTFFTESFVDELAHLAGMEPLAFRMSMLGGNPRLARCLETAAEAAQWDGGGGGSTMGIAGCSAFGSHIALVANATIGEDQRVKVHRLVAAVDCGRVINSGLVIQQIAGGLIWALGQANAAAPEWTAGMPRARWYGTLGLPGLGDTPDFTIRLIPSAAPSGGVSGLGVTVLAPAVANAIYGGTGRRLRSLPFEVA